MPVFGSKPSIWIWELSTVGTTKLLISTSKILYKYSIYVHTCCFAGESSRKSLISLLHKLKAREVEAIFAITEQNGGSLSVYYEVWQLKQAGAHNFGLICAISSCFLVIIIIIKKISTKWSILIFMNLFPFLSQCLINKQAAKTNQPFLMLLQPIFTKFKSTNTYFQSFYFVSSQ